MIKKASIYTMNAFNKSSELWHTSVNLKARPVVEGKHDKNWNDHGGARLLGFFQIQNTFRKYSQSTNFQPNAAFAYKLASVDSRRKFSILLRIWLDLVPSSSFGSVWLVIAQHGNLAHS